MKKGRESDKLRSEANKRKHNNKRKRKYIVHNVLNS